MPERQDEKPDDSAAILRAVEELTGGEPMTREAAEEAFADPETARKYREAMEGGKAQKEKRPIGQP